MSEKIPTAAELARKIVGDGKDPNLFFVTMGPYYRNIEGDARTKSGWTEESDFVTYGPFDTYDKAREKYEEIELSYEEGISEVIIEDRKTGTITQKFLREKVTLVEDEFDDACQFGYTK